MFKPQKLESVRARNAALKAERDALQNATPNVADVSASLTARLRADAEASDRAARSRLLAGEHEMLMVARPKPDGTIDLGPVLLRLFGADAIAAALLRHVADQTATPTAAERAARRAEIERELMSCELEEERQIEASEAAGTPVARRPDADVRAVLGERE